MPVDSAALRSSVQDLLARIDSVAGPGGLSEGLEAVIAAAERVLGVDCVGILLLDEDDQLRSVAGSAVAADGLVADGAYRHLTGHSDDGPGVRAVVSAPVWVNGVVAGNLHAMRRGRHAWRTDEIAAVETYADVIAALLQVSVGRGRLRHDARSDRAPGDLS